MLTWDPEGPDSLAVAMERQILDIDRQIDGLEERLLMLRSRKAELVRTRKWVVESEIRGTSAS